METKHLTYFKVENFKRFDSLEVKDIGQFNLVVGDNNVGKTSFLEALLFDDEDYSQFLKNICNALLFNRHITIPEDEINYLDFYLKNKKLPIIFTYASNERQNKLLLDKALLNDLTEEEFKKIDPWTVRNNNTMHLIRFNLNNAVDFRLASLQFLIKSEQDNSLSAYFPFIGVNPRSNYDIFNFSKITISTAKLESLQNELNFFIPNLVSIELNNAIVPKVSTLAIREKNADLQPFSQYGDGVIKLFKYLLELELYGGKRLMIDEIDTGVHYSKMKEFFKKILQSAKEKNVQIFATTHSKECLEYYKQALEELGLQDSGRIIKIADTKSGIKSFTFNFAQFDNALFAGSEIR